MTTLLGDAICNIEEEEYWEARQHALKGERPLVMMMRVAIARVIVVVTVDMVMTIATVIVKVTIVKTMIANTMAMIGVNPLVVENM